MIDPDYPDGAVTEEEVQQAIEEDPNTQELPMVIDILNFVHQYLIYIIMFFVVSGFLVIYLFGT